MFSQRIVSTDHYQAVPVPDLDVTHSQFRGADVKRVPVLRIFGATPAGQKTCMHVHGVFPYLYVPYDGTQPWERYLRLFAISLDKAINVGNNSAKSDIQHVYKISLVKGIPMYGYHGCEEDFLKIYFYNPSSVKKAADLLLAGAVMNKPFQPHEAHVPYNLQLFIDYNLYGMNLINVAAVKFRRSLADDNGNPAEDAGKKSPSSSQCSDTSFSPKTPVIGVADSSSCSGMNTPCRKMWDAPSIPSELCLDRDVIRQTSCELEVDVVAADILNRQEVDANIGTNPGLAAIWEDEKQRRRDMGESSQITPPASQDRGDVEVAESENILRRRLLEIIEEQKAFLDSQSEAESEMSQGSQEDFTATPASQVDLHPSQDVDESGLSQDTVIMDDAEREENEEPIISMQNIQRVLSFSQSFSQQSGSGSEGPDRTLADVLVSLADDTSPVASQLSASQLVAMEERDSVMGMSERTGVVDEETLREEEEETLEMSQIVCHEEEEEHTSDDEEEDKDITEEEHNLEGLEDTWVEPQSGSDEEDDRIPQFDGASDEKTNDAVNQRKRLGMRGQIIPHNPAGHRTNPNFQQQYHRPFNSYNTANHYGGGMNHAPPFSPGMERFPAFNHDYGGGWHPGYQMPSTVSRHNWEHSVWQEQVSHQSYPSFQTASQMEHSELGYQHGPSQPYSSNMYNQYQHPYGNEESYREQIAFPQASPNFRSHASQVSPNYVPNQLPNSSQMSVLNMLNSSHDVNNTVELAQFSPHSSQNPELLGSNVHHMSAPQLRAPVPSHQSPTVFPADPMLSGSKTDVNASFQQMLNSPLVQDVSVNRCMSTSSVHSGTSFTSDGRDMDLSEPSPFSDQRSDTLDKYVNSIDTHSAVPNLTTVELASNEFSASIQKNHIRDNSQDDLFGTSPRTLISGSTPSLSVDESTESTGESVVDMTGCDDFLPAGYDSAGSENNSASPSGLQYTDLNQQYGRTDRRRDSCPSSITSLMNLVTSVNDSNFSHFRSRSKLSLKRTKSDGGLLTRDHPWSQETFVNSNVRNSMISMAPSYYPWGTSDNQLSNCVVSNPNVHSSPSPNPTKRLKNQKGNLKSVRQSAKSLFHPKVPVPDPSYTYAFHVPTPVYKRLKLRYSVQPYSDGVKIVRMHPRDARRYSLLKIGREIVSVPRLNSSDLVRLLKKESLSLHESSKDLLDFNTTNNDQTMVQSSKPSSSRVQERVPVLSQFGSLLENPPFGVMSKEFENGGLSPTRLPEISPPRKRTNRIQVKTLLKEKFSKFKTNLEIVQQPTRLEDVLESRIQEVENETKCQNSEVSENQSEAVKIPTGLNFDLIKEKVCSVEKDAPLCSLHTESSAVSGPDQGSPHENTTGGNVVTIVENISDFNRTISVSSNSVKPLEMENDLGSHCDNVDLRCEHSSPSHEHSENKSCSKKTPNLESNSQEDILSGDLVLSSDSNEHHPNMDERGSDDEGTSSILKAFLTRKPYVAKKSVGFPQRSELFAAHKGSNRSSSDETPCQSSNHQASASSFCSPDKCTEKQMSISNGDVTLDDQKRECGSMDVSVLDQSEAGDLSVTTVPQIDDVQSEHASTTILESEPSDKGQEDTSKKGKNKFVKKGDDLSVADATIKRVLSSGIYSDREHSSEADSVFSVPRSRASSRASSRKESSDSSEGGGGRLKKLKKRKHSDNFSRAGYRRKRHKFKNKSRKNRSRRKLQYVDDDDDPFKNMILGVHYVVVGRFKGHKSMQVKLSRPRLDGTVVNVHDYFSKHLDEKLLFDRAIHSGQERPSSAESLSTISEYLMESKIVNCKSSEDSELSDAPLEFDQHDMTASGVVLDEKTGELISSENKNMNNNCEELCLPDSQSPKAPVENWLNNSPLANADCEDLCESMDTSKQEAMEVVENSVDEIPTQKNVEKHDTSKLGEFGACEKSTADTSAPSPVARYSSSTECYTPNDFVQTEGPHNVLSAKANSLESPTKKQDTEKIVEPVPSTSDMSGAVDQKNSQPVPYQVRQESSSSDSSGGRPHLFLTFKQSKKSLSKSPKMNMTENRKRRKLTLNQRLGVAFLSTRHKRKKSSNGCKLMNSLSILHQATLANLTDSLSYADGTDDYKTKYEDVMYKLALVSPPQSDKGETSPPVPLSPEDLDKDALSQRKQKTVTSNTPFSLSSSVSASCSKVATSETASRTSIESIYDTPLSSVENKDNKIPEVVPGCTEIRHESVSVSSSMDVHSGTSDTIHPSSASQILKKAFVCLTRLTTSDVDKLTSDLKNKESCSSPPNLGSPILQYKSKSGSCSDSSSACGSGPTPPWLTPHRSPRSLHSASNDELGDVSCAGQADFGGAEAPVNEQLSSPQPGSQSSENVTSLKPNGSERNIDSRLSFNEYASLSHDSSSNQSRNSDSSGSGDSRKENCEALENHGNNSKVKEKHSPTPKYSELKLSVRNLLTPKENEINARTLPEHYDMDCALVVKSSEYEDISSDEDNDGNDDDYGYPTDATGRRQKKSAQQSNQSRGSGRKAADGGRARGLLPQDTEDKSIKDSSGGDGGMGGCHDPQLYYGNVVLRPQMCPPTRNMVCISAHMYGLYTSTAQNAYCSNPQDMPEKPRELGGNLLKLESNRVSDLEEFETSAGTEGLKNWRTILAAENNLFSSQSVEPLWQKLDKDPEFRFVLSSDRRIIIAPCHLPPSKTPVQKWLSARVERVRLKSQTSVLEDTVTKDNNNKSEKDPSDDECIQFCELAAEVTVEESKTDDELISSEHGNESQVDKAKEPDHLVNPKQMKSDDQLIGTVDDVDIQTTAVQQSEILQTESMSVDDPSDGGCEELEDSVEMDVSRHDKIVPEDNSKEILDMSVEGHEKDGGSSVQIVHLKRTISDAGEVVVSDENVKEIASSSVKTSPVFSTRWDQKNGNKAASKHTSIDPGESSLPPVHSTPVRRPSVEWLEPVCTPISTIPDKAVADSRHGSNPFVTPQKPGPVRRLSSNTETSLRRSILSSQLKHQLTTPTPKHNISQIDGPTPKNTYGFKVTQQNYQDAKALHEHQYLTVMSLEVHVETRGDLRPDPEVDAMQAIFYSIFDDIPPEKGDRHVTGAILVDLPSARKKQPQIHSPQPSASKTTSTSKTSPKPSTSKFSPIPSTSRADNQGGNRGQVDTLLKKSGVEDDDVEYVASEQELIDAFIKVVMKWDPDIVTGYEIQMSSWGYVLQRASHLGTDLCTKISRTPDSKTGNKARAGKDDWASDYTSEINIVGRIVLNLWRLLKHEVTLNIYSYENVAFHILHQRIPLYSTRTLTFWYNHRSHHHRWRVVEYYHKKVKGVLQIMEQLDLIGKTSEFARVFGIEFYNVLSRGSQYRVESMMLRLAKPMNFVPVSPGVDQRARQKAIECIPLTLEPESRFYPHPVVVLDFQSLYPSIMIAYNYCFSTCLGRVESLSKAHEGPFNFGCTSLKISPSTLKTLEKDVTISPNGVVFVKDHIRRGVLPRMVSEILNTRIMVKKAMKDYKKDKTLYRLLDARQLGLKLIANVTYGYTGASFSGRMPCVEVADSIVRKARESLEQAIKLVEDTPHWRARVVYGDTDSMFIHLEGRTKDEAFKIGQEIADAVTAMYPKPMKLKFEKVYQPCVLQTKKRYVGFSYETPDQKEPIFDAKGIETVRRDTCGAVSKILERCIKLLFTTRDVSQVKAFVLRQCHKFMQGKVSIQDCVFAKEFRGMTGYKPVAYVPGLEIARKLVRQDHRAEPRVGERIPYVIIYGSPGTPLIQLVRHPLEVLRDPTLRINGTYYITKQILPPLHRLLSLIGVDVFTWYQDMPKVIRVVPQVVVSGEAKKGTISQYFSVSNCPVCDEQTKQPICPQCMKNPQMVCVTLVDRIRQWDTVHHRLSEICYSCMGAQDETHPCVSLDCPILFRKTVAQSDVFRGEHLRQNLEKMLQF